MPSDNESVACVDRKKSYGTALLHMIQQNVSYISSSVRVRVSSSSSSSRSSGSSRSSSSSSSSTSSGSILVEGEVLVVVATTVPGTVQ